MKAEELYQRLIKGGRNFLGVDLAGEDLSNGFQQH